MDSERNELLKRLCSDAHELPLNERATFLDQACAGDDELRREVESLLSFDETGTGFLDRTAWKQIAGEIVHEEIVTLLDKTVGHYHIQSLLGEGGMGKVFLAHDTKLGRKVAIKFLPQHFTFDPERVHRFEQEARAASALNHPHIITIHEIGAHEDWHYLVMEHVAGQTLRTRLQAGKLTHEEAVDMAAQVADALAAAHQAGIIHRDIKPENIMLRDDGKVKVLDFGIAKLGEESEKGRRGDGAKGRWGKETSGFINSPTLPFSASPTLPFATALGTVLGTVNYMSPEQARGEPLTGQADIFSLGQMLLEMVTGKGEFASKKPEEVLFLLRSEGELPDYKFDGVPRVLEQIICKSLKRNLAERYETAQQLLNDLKTLQRHTATKLLRRGIVGGASGVALLFIALVLAVWFSINETWPEKILRDGHTAAVRRAVFSPDGQRLVSGSEDHQVIVWDFARREKLKTLTHHTGWVNSIAYSPDGKWFATGSSDKSVIVWDAEKMEKVKMLNEHRDAVKAVAFSPDGKLLATSSGSDTGGNVDFRTVLWEVNGWRQLRALPEGRTYGNLLFSPDSRWLKTQDSQWEVATGSKVTTTGDALGLNWHEFAPGANQLLGVGAGSVARYQLLRPGQLMGRKLIGDYESHQDFGRAVAFSPDGKLVVTGADDLVIWDAATMNIQGRFPSESSVWGVTFSPDGRWLVSTHGDGTIQVWNVAQRRPEFSFGEHASAVRTVAISPDGKRYASAGDDRSIIIWNAETGLKEAVLRKHATRVTNLVFSPNGKWLASLDQKGQLIRWELERQLDQWEINASQGAPCLAISPDGRWLVTRHVIIDSNDGRKLFGLGKPDNDLEFLNSAAFSLDGKLLAGVEGNQVMLVDPKVWRIVDRKADGNAPLVAVKFSPDGTKLLTGSTDGTLLLWETKPLRKLGMLGQHVGRISSVSFSSDGEIVVSAGSDKEVKLWDVKARKLLRDVGTHTSPVAAVVFAPDGKRLLTGEQDRSVRVYTQHRELWGRELDMRHWFLK